MKKYIGLAITVLLLVTLGAGAIHAQDAAGGTLIGAFDVGPGGAPLIRPFMDTAGRTWLSKIWTPLISYNAEA